MNKLEQMKILSIASVLLGLVLGLFGVVPFLGSIAAIVLFLLAAPAVYIYGIKYLSLQLKSNEQSLLFGATVGFISLIGFSISFLILAYLLTLVFDIEALIWAKSLFSQGLFVPIMVVIFTGILSSLMNCFTSLVAFWLMNKYNQ